MLAAAMLLTAFALELADTQAKVRRDVTDRVHERATLATSLLDAFFQSSAQQLGEDPNRYGGRVVSAATMEAGRGSHAYLLLLDPAGERVLAASGGFTAQARADLADSAAVRLVRDGHRYGLGNILPYGGSGVINLAVRIPTDNGDRILVAGMLPSTLSQFLVAELAKIPGVAGAYSYLIDGNRALIASTNPRLATGHVFRRPAEVRALAQSSGMINGRYYDQVRFSSSTWRLLLAAPARPLFASVSGVRRWLPWGILASLLLVSLAAFALARRAQRAGDRARAANVALGDLNDELARANDALSRRAAELARSNDELDQFASIASHDLQEPLRKVRTFTGRLQTMESERLSEKGIDYLERANSAAARMQQLVEDLLRYSRVATQGQPFVPVDLAVVAREVLADLDQEVERSGATVTVGELPTINADPRQMRQLLQNLVSNALKFARADATPTVELAATHVDRRAVLTVRDNGIGFEPRYEERIFRVFERLHGRHEYPGTGIGLALCRKIVERHGGSIRADGVPGVGATFTVELPTDRTEEVIVIRSDDERGAHMRDAEETLHV
ncbi:ATP-binding protein [Conexibacter sp. JD483]|uniref:sensor histidine kinase n=1 Tax=unclassified Conexibacter TaxID=2627773 RepID=UPI0027231D04|nr:MULTISPECIES: ATP-binding protein [unclassified Conexibacter]MDO8187963.1 ATP-binding protein [Conexibacter sp. CPCC 205706]MDO8200168.1 ATP-binding protein [Conexibacter sp. CPCC 205762]MDR9369714.1 ATP-binding protein [Conexibacter sp. JD483]